MLSLLRALGVLLMALGLATLAYAIYVDESNPPRQYYPVGNYDCHLCLKDGHVTVLRPVDGAEPACGGESILAHATVIRSVPLRKVGKAWKPFHPNYFQPSADELAQAGPDRAVLIHLQGGDGLTTALWDSGEPSPSSTAMVASSGLLHAEWMPQTKVDLILPVLAGELADMAGAELGDAVRGGGIPVSSLPPLNKNRQPPYLTGFALLLAGLGAYLYGQIRIVKSKADAARA